MDEMKNLELTDEQLENATGGDFIIGEFTPIKEDEKEKYPLKGTRQPPLGDLGPAGERTPIFQGDAP